MRISDWSSDVCSSDLMRAFIGDYIRPDNMKILVAGDTTLDKIIPELNAAFGNWKAPAGKIPAKNIGKVAAPDQVRVYLVDRPGAQQSLILAGSLAPSTKAIGRASCRERVCQYV